ncbi:MAG: DNA repair protein [Campylobacterota bacterium]|nr:DNA repair protein [Campylobacterota bacterium]
MGIFSKVWGACKSIAKKTVEVVSDAYDYVKEKGSKLVGAITGKNTFNEAEDLLQKIEDRYDKAKFQYEKDVKEISSQLEVKINTINYHKKDIFDNHFDRFKTIGDRLHNINIEGKNFLEYFDDNITKIKKLEALKDRSELYGKSKDGEVDAIDFNNLSLYDIAEGFLTLGFMSRKRANKSLYNVKKEVCVVCSNIVKMKSQVRKLKVVEKSIDNVAEYFEVLIENYSKLLDRFGYGVSSQILKENLDNKKLENGKLDFKLMPIVHIEEFQALFNLSIILKQMATMGYLTEDGKIEDKDIEAVNDIKYKIEQLEILAS